MGRKQKRADHHRTIIGVVLAIALLLWLSISFVTVYCGQHSTGTVSSFNNVKLLSDFAFLGCFSDSLLIDSRIDYYSRFRPRPYLKYSVFSYKTEKYDYTKVLKQLEEQYQYGGAVSELKSNATIETEASDYQLSKVLSVAAKLDSASQLMTIPQWDLQGFLETDRITLRSIYDSNSKYAVFYIYVKHNLHDD